VEQPSELGATNRRDERRENPMTGSQGAKRRLRREHPIAIWAAIAGVTYALAISVVAVALASTTVTIGSQSNSKLGKKVVVDAQGRTLYALSGESRSHQFCSAECLKFWPPSRVSSKTAHLKAGSGVHGKLSVLSRPAGILQVTLRGLPLYRFAGDKAKGEANGEGIVGPGGHVWHAVAPAGGATHATPTTQPSMPSPAPPSTTPSYPTPGYGY
jgi:predicted lipoprotein with Yx(FWY)xxD motif